MTDVLPLAGFVVGITAARRADELGALLVRKGASVRYGPAIRIVPLTDDTELHVATTRLLESPVDAVVATTGIGFRGWLEAAEGWGLGDALLSRLSSASLLARGPKVTGAIRAAGLSEDYSPASESNAELLQHLLASGVAGMRIAVQLHGEPLPYFVDTLRAAGAEVIEISVYRWVGPVDPGPVDRLLDARARGVDPRTAVHERACGRVARRAGSPNGPAAGVGLGAVGPGGGGVRRPDHGGAAGGLGCADGPAAPGADRRAGPDGGRDAGRAVTPACRRAAAASNSAARRRSSTASGARWHPRRWRCCGRWRRRRGGWFRGGS